MRSPQTGQPATSRDGWTFDVRGIVQIAIVCALVAASWALLHRGREAQWPLVQGNIQDIRIVADHAIENKMGRTANVEGRIQSCVFRRES